MRIKGTKKITTLLVIFTVGLFLSCKKNTPKTSKTSDIKWICRDSITDSHFGDYLRTCFDSISNEKKHAVSLRGKTKHGTATKYFKNGKEEIIENYQLGVLEGWARRYNSRGNLIYEKYYRKGKPVYTNIEGEKDYFPYLEYPTKTYYDSTYNFLVYFLPKIERGSLILDFGMNECDSRIWDLHRVDLDDNGNAVQPFHIDFIGETCIGSQISDSLNAETKYNHQHEKIFSYRKLVGF